MDWWARFKKRFTRASDGGASGTQVLIMAECVSADIPEMMIAISQVRPDGATFKSRGGLRPGTRLTIRIPMRGSASFVPIKAVVMEARVVDVAASEFEAEVRFTETHNSRRDRWVASLLGTHGVTMSDLRPVSERRGEHRYKTSLPVRVRVGEQLASGYVRDISLGGMLALVDGEVAEGDTAVFELQLPAVPQLLKLNGRIVHHEPGDGDAFAVIGVAFEALPEDRVELLTTGLRAIARNAGRKQGI